MSVQFGQAVKYTEGEKTFDALVLGVRTDLTSHTGANGEPLIHLAFANPAKANVAGTGSHAEVIEHRFDVAHSSHEFTEEQKKQFGDAYPGGRWAFFTEPLGAVLQRVAAAGLVPPQERIPNTPLSIVEPDVTKALDAAGPAPSAEEPKKPGNAD